MFKKILALTVAAMMAMSLAITVSAEDAVEDDTAIVEDDGEYVAEEDGVVEDETTVEEESTEQTVEDEIAAAPEALPAVEDKGADTGVGNVAVASAIALVATAAVIFSRKKK